MKDCCKNNKNFKKGNDVDNSYNENCGCGKSCCNGKCEKKCCDKCTCASE